MRRRFRKTVAESGLEGQYVTAKSSELSKNVDFRVIPPKWFKLPSSEYAIARGKEVVMECELRGAKAHVFTASPFTGSLKLSEVIDLNLDTLSSRSVFYGSLNALMRYLGLIDRTIHCRGDEPLKCAEELVNKILKCYGDVPTLLVGYQPAMAKALARELNVLHITDMSPENAGKIVSGVQVLNHTKNLDLLENVKVALVTGSTVVNSSLWPIYEKAQLRVSITSRCNLNCFYCHREGEKNHGKEMSAERIAEIAESFYKLGVRKIKLTGGEPLVRKDIFEILSLDRSTIQSSACTATEIREAVKLRKPYFLDEI